MIKKLEILANICVVITSVVLCSVLIKKYVLSSTKPEAPVEAVQSKPPASSASRRPSIQAGTKITLPGIDWSKSTRTVVLALSTTCHFCSESAPLSEASAAKTKQRATRRGASRGGRGQQELSEQAGRERKRHSARFARFGRRVEHSDAAID